MILSVLYSLLLPLRFWICLIKEKPEKVIVNTSLSHQNLVRDGILVLISKLLGCRTILVVHGFQRSKLKPAFLLKWGYFKSDVIFVLAEQFKLDIQNAGYKGTIMLQYNPIEDNIWNEIDDVVKTKELKHIKNILFLSRIERSKGIYILLDAFKVLQAQYPDIVLRIAGTGNELDVVRKYIHDETNVEFMGFVTGSDKLKLLEMSDVFVLPSYTEGLPISVLEAMALGNYIITRPVGGLVDLHVKSNFGLLVESLEPADFVKAMKYAIEDDVSRIRKNNMIFAKNNFSAKQIAERLQNI